MPCHVVARAWAMKLRWERHVLGIVGAAVPVPLATPVAMQRERGSGTTLSSPVRCSMLNS